MSVVPGREHSNRDRLQAAIGVALLHALLGYALIMGLGVEVATRMGSELKLFDVREPPPPPPETVPAPARAEQPEGPASPVSLKASPTPLIAPPPLIRLPATPPIVSAPQPTPVPVGSDPNAGVAAVAGPGTGMGGQGVGIGSGGRGDGSGGAAVRAQRVSGAISGERDYPRAARRAGVEGTVSVRFTVEPDGGTSGCRITRSSGSAELDETTCRLIELRFRYRPARDSEGRPVPENVTRTFDWLLPFRD